VHNRSRAAVEALVAAGDAGDDTYGRARAEIVIDGPDTPDVERAPR
jgi:hypothetical protein